MVRIPITEEEANQIPAQVRSAVENQTRLIPRGLDPGGETAPSPSGPTEPYVTEQEYTAGWENADVSPDGDTPLPGLPEEEVPGGVEEPVTPVEPIEPIEPVEPIMPEEFFEEIIP
jgi:hypothetical protein